MKFCLFGLILLALGLAGISNDEIGFDQYRYKLEIID